MDPEVPIMSGLVRYRLSPGILTSGTILLSDGNSNFYYHTDHQVSFVVYIFTGQFCDASYPEGSEYPDYHHGSRSRS